jgi:hypothetical protein
MPATSRRAPTAAESPAVTTGVTRRLSPVTRRQSPAYVERPPVTVERRVSPAPVVFAPRVVVHTVLAPTYFQGPSQPSTPHFAFRDSPQPPVKYPDVSGERTPQLLAPDPAGSSPNFTPSPQMVKNRSPRLPSRS